MGLLSVRRGGMKRLEDAEMGLRQLFAAEWVGSGNVKNLVESTGGSFQVNSGDGHGTTVTTQLPRLISDDF